MDRTARFGLAAWLLLAVPSLVHAQRAARVTISPAAPRAKSAAVRQETTHATASRKVTRAKAADSGSPFGDPLTIQQLLDPFPGFGFDFEHLNAIDRDLAIKALIDPATEQRLAVAERIARRGSRFGNSGFFLLDGGGAYILPPGPDASDQAPPEPQQRPQVIVVQMPATQQAGQESAAGPEAYESEPLPDVGEFKLVLRNGSQIRAVAFTRTDDKIVYITPSGGRRTLAVADLDTDSTERTNQENGTPLQLSL